MSKLARLLRYDWPLHLALLLTNWLPDNVIFMRLRGSLATPFFGSCGKDLRLGRDVSFYNPSRIHVGAHIYIAHGCRLIADGIITLEDEVLLGPYVVMATANHTRLNGSYRYGTPQVHDVVVGRGSWIGAHVSINAGAQIGSGCLIASNAVVTRGLVAADSFLAGVPATIKRKLAS